MIWLLYVLGCTTETVHVYSSVTQAEQNAVVEDTAHLAELDAISPPQIATIEDMLQAGIEQVRYIRVGRLLDVYDSMLDKADSECPRWFSDVGGFYWADTCMSSEGVSFQGFATSYPRNDLVPDDYGNMFSGRQIHCEGTLSHEDTTMQCVGGISELTGTDANGHDIFYSFSRHYVLTQGNQKLYFPDLEMWAVSAPTYRAIFHNGVHIVRNGDTIVGAVEFGHQTFNNAGCENEPNGTQHVQVEGQWIFIEWHGDVTETLDFCDGCGDAYAQGTYIGQVCADYSSWLTWETSPFEDL